MTSSPVARATRVALVITRLDIGGAQETVLALASHLRPPHFEVTVIAGKEVEAGESVVPELRRQGLPVVLVDEMHSAIRPAADGKAVVVLRRELRRLSPHIVHTHSSKAGVLGRLAAILMWSKRPAIVHTVHGWSFHSHQAPHVAAVFRTVERFLARFTDALVVVAAADRENGLRAAIAEPERYHLIPSGIVLHDSVTELASRRDAPFTVVFVGRLAEQKNPLLAVRGFAAFHERAPRSRLLMIGDGPLRTEVNALTEGLGLQRAVELLGVRRDVRRLLRQANAFLLTSNWEGMPRTVLEAAAERVPVVTNLVGGLGELIEDGCSGLVHDGTPEGIATALLRLLDDPCLGEAVAAEATARLAPYDAAVMIARTATLYDDLRRSR